MASKPKRPVEDVLRILLKLYEDPHPGLATWNEALVRMWQELKQHEPEMSVRQILRGMGIPDSEMTDVVVRSHD